MTDTLAKHPEGTLAELVAGLEDALGRALEDREHERVTISADGQKAKLHDRPADDPAAQPVAIYYARRGFWRSGFKPRPHVGSRLTLAGACMKRPPLTRAARPRERRAGPSRRSTTRAGPSADDGSGEPGEEPPPPRRPLELRYDWRLQLWRWRRDLAAIELAEVPHDEQQLAMAEAA